VYTGEGGFWGREGLIIRRHKCLVVCAGVGRGEVQSRQERGEALDDGGEDEMSHWGKEEGWARGGRRRWQGVKRNLLGSVGWHCR
jgi:hypothetical protein